MRRPAALFAAACLGSTLAVAQSAAEPDAPTSPVVLELYTSQGCSSCPPADELFATLAQRDDVIALALHVDYWDYLGWKDELARPRHAARQKAYAKAARSRTIYTPEMIVQGEDRLKGHDAATIADEIAAHRREAPGAALAVAREGDVLRIDIAPASGSVEGRAPDAGIGFAAAAAPLQADVHVVRYIPEERVAIEAGENAGRTMTYLNIVTDWQTIGQWDGVSDANFVYDHPAPGPVAVIVQRARTGPILAAARLP
jgi:hypothetical protein